MNMSKHQISEKFDPIPDWLKKCYDCKHLLIKKRNETEYHCKRGSKGCKFEEYKPKVGGENE